MPSLQFRFETAVVGKKQIEAPRVVWGGENAINVGEEIMRGNEAGKDTARSRAMEFLKGFLSGGGPRPSAEVFKAASQAGLTEITLRRAIEGLEIVSTKEKGRMDVQWMLELPKLPI
jgi:hypothetical protein